MDGGAQRAPGRSEDTVYAVYAQRGQRGFWHLLGVTNALPAALGDHSGEVGAVSEPYWLREKQYADATPDALLLRRYSCLGDVLEVLPPDNGHSLPANRLRFRSSLRAPLRRGRALERARLGAPRRMRSRRGALVAAAGAVGLLVTWVAADSWSEDPPADRR